MTEEIKDRYRTVAAYELAGLDLLVNLHVRSGWTPLGGPAFGRSSGRDLWTQALWADRSTVDPYRW